MSDYDVDGFCAPNSVGMEVVGALELRNDGKGILHPDREDALFVKEMDPETAKALGEIFASLGI